MDRLQRLALERRAMDSRPDGLNLRLFGASALTLLGTAAAGMVVISLHLFDPRDAGLVLALAVLSGWPLFRLGRRHARRTQATP